MLLQSRSIHHNADIAAGKESSVLLVPLPQVDLQESGPEPRWDQAAEIHQG